MDRLHKSLVLQILIVASMVCWLLYWFLLPIKTAAKWFDEIDRRVSFRFLGTSGSIFFLQAVPFMVMAFLSYLVVGFRRIRKPPDRAKTRKPSINVWTLPILVKSPIGMITLGDLIFVTVILFVTIWFIVKTSIDGASDVDRLPVLPSMPSRWVTKFKIWGDAIGLASLIPFALLWIPVSRGSPFLRVMGVPFEHVITHHIWMGSLTVWLAAVHTAFLMFYLVHERRIDDILSWHTTKKNACIPGMVAMAAGILMLVTALGAVRRRFYDLFFRVHHLYIAYVVFFAFHSVYQMYILIVPVMLFFLDRFMRMVQSRKDVDIVSAKVLPSGAMELRFSKPESLRYDALSFVYVLLPSVSRLQWHPFSVASSPLDETNELCIYIKPLGKFTKSLHDALVIAKRCQSMNNGRQPLFNSPFSFKVSLEGPYGDESSFYLKYQRLVMVAGGIGVTPFLAMLRDILHRYRLKQEGLPSSVHLIFCCRQAYELDILHTLQPSNILPGYQEHLTIKIHAYVTSKIAERALEDLSDGSTWTDIEINDESSYVNINKAKLTYRHMDSQGPKPAKRISAILSTGHTGWVGATVSATLLGFITSWGVINITLLTEDSRNYTKVLFYILSVVLAIVLFGGGIILIWAFFEWNKSKNTISRVNFDTSSLFSPMRARENDTELGSPSRLNDTAFWKGDLNAGRRPDFKEIFAKMAIDFDNEDVGVVVSGSPFMQVDVAKECQRHSLSRSSKVIMHYHSVSFEF